MARAAHRQQLRLDQTKAINRKRHVQNNIDIHTQQPRLDKPEARVHYRKHPYQYTTKAMYRKQLHLDQTNAINRKWHVQVNMPIYVQHPRLGKPEPH